LGTASDCDLDRVLILGVLFLGRSDAAASGHVAINLNDRWASQRDPFDERYLWE